MKALWAAALLPPLGVWVLIRALGVNVPFEDDWDVLAVVTKWHAGTLAFADFWQQHSEHRIAALKGMFWAVGAVTDVDLVEAMRVGFALSVIKLALLVDIIRRHLSGPAYRLIAPLALASSLLMFSLVQHEDWFWATASLQFSLLNLCTVMLVWLLSRRPDSWLALAAAIACAVVALLTEVSGYVLWVTGGAAIWLFTERPARGVQRLSVWLAAAVSATAIYWWNLQWAPSSTAMSVLEGPWRFVQYAGALLGLPFAFWMTTRWAAVVGYAGLIPFVFVSWSLFRSNRPLLHTLAPFLLFAFHGVLVCLLIALGRSSGDPDSALTSHYSFAPNLYWVGVLAVTAVGAWTRLSTSTPSRRRAGLVLAGAAALLLATGFVQGNVEGYQRAYTRSRNLQMAFATLASSMENPRPVLRFLYPPDEQRAERLVSEMRASKLGLFAPGMTGDSTMLAAKLNPVPAGPIADGFLDGGDCIGATGWAWDPAHPDAPVEVDVWIGDSLIGTATANWFRWDLLAAGIGNGQHAFRFYFPEQSVLRTGRDVRVTFSGTDTPVPGSPKTIFCRD